MLLSKISVLIQVIVLGSLLMILSIIGYSSYKLMKEDMEELVVQSVAGALNAAANLAQQAQQQDLVYQGLWPIELRSAEQLDPLENCKSLFKTLLKDTGLSLVASCRESSILRASVSFCVARELSNTEHCIYEYLPNRKFGIEYGLKVPGVALVRNGV